MNMESRLTCNYYRQTVYVPPSEQHIRCLRCKEVFSVSDSNDVGHHSRTSDTSIRYKGIPPSDQHINCFGWEIDYSDGNIRDNYVQNYSGTEDWYLELPKKKIEAKFLCRNLRKIFSFSNALQSQTGMPPRAISMRDQPPRGRPALLCGVSYKKQKHELKGVAQNVNNVYELLLYYYHFPPESILILAEEEPHHQLTRANIQEAFQWLVRGIRPGDSLVFYFSGHGKRQRDYNCDEVDGFDDTICPVDFEKNGMIVDNDINEAIVRPLTKDVTLHSIIDSCHSWNVLDVPHVYNITRGKWEDNSPPSGAPKGTSGGKAICFSVCEDYQLVVDTSAFSQEKEIIGAMTITFINAVKKTFIRNESITYQGIMDSMHNSIKEAGKPGGFFAGIRRIFHHRILQLSSSEEFNTSTLFKL